jgi:carbonic anhydrase/acetyltransferase-like protein (isoleucine patch superfamily)
MKLHENIYIANGTQISGDVTIEDSSSIWYNCVLRGDIAPIKIGHRTNIQDGSILHVDNNQPCIIGDDVTVGHGCILHGCTIENGCLIGMGAIILNGAHIKQGAVIGAGAVVKENSIVESNSLFVGIPAKLVKILGDENYQKNIHHAKEYIKLAQNHKEKRLFQKEY